MTAGLVLYCQASQRSHGSQGRSRNRRESTALDTYANTHGYCDCNSHCHAYSNSYGDFNAANYSHAPAHPTTKRTPNAASASLSGVVMRPQ